MTETKMLFAEGEKVDFMFAGPIPSGEAVSAGGVIASETPIVVTDGSVISGGFTPSPGSSAGTSIGGGSMPAPTPGPIVGTTGGFTPTPTPTPGTGTTTTASTTAATGTIAKLMDGSKATASSTIEQTKDLAASLSSNILWAILFVIGAAFAGYLFVAKK